MNGKHTEGNMVPLRKKRFSIVLSESMCCSSNNHMFERRRRWSWLNLHTQFKYDGISTLSSMDPDGVLSVANTLAGLEGTGLDESVEDFVYNIVRFPSNLLSSHYSLCSNQTFSFPERNYSDTAKDAYCDSSYYEYVLKDFNSSVSSLFSIIFHSCWTDTARSTLFSARYNCRI